MTFYLIFWLILQYCRQYKDDFQFQDINFIQMKASRTIQVDDPKQKLKSTRASFFHKALGRDVRPAWGNRIVKDFYDLDYDIPSSLTLMTRKFRKTSSIRSRDSKSLLLKHNKTNRRNSLKENLSLALSERSKSLELKQDNYAQKMSLHNPEIIEIGPLPGSSSNYLGLSNFQYQKTIQGKVQTRLSHHVNFEKNKVMRIINQNPIYYNKNKDIDFSQSKMINERRTIKKIHPFDSYTQRSVFEPRNELDKIFDTDSAKRTISPQRVREAVRKFERIIQRRQVKLNESAALAYETIPAIVKLKKKPISLPIPMITRETSFSPEVISSKRGCKR